MVNAGRITMRFYPVELCVLNSDTATVASTAEAGVIKLTSILGTPRRLLII